MGDEWAGRGCGGCGGGWMDMDRWVVGVWVSEWVGWRDGEGRWVCMKETRCGVEVCECVGVLCLYRLTNCGGHYRRRGGSLVPRP